MKQNAEHFFLNLFLSFSYKKPNPVMLFYLVSLHSLLYHIVCLAYRQAIKLSKSLMTEKNNIFCFEPVECIKKNMISTIYEDRTFRSKDNRFWPFLMVAASFERTFVHGLCTFTVRVHLDIHCMCIFALQSRIVYVQPTGRLRDLYLFSMIISYFSPLETIPRNSIKSTGHYLLIIVLAAKTNGCNGQ